MGATLSDRELAAGIVAALDRGEAVVTATVVDTERSVPRRPGAKMLIFADGTTVGSIGGGEMEARVVSAAPGVIAGGVPRRLRYELLDPGDGDPGVCGGTVELHLEPHLPSPSVLVVGCGHVGRAVVELAHWLGFRVIAHDDRIEMASAEHLPFADVVVAGPIAAAMAYVTERSSIVVVTRNVAVDLEILPVLLASPAPYVGVMGSRRRWATTRPLLQARGVTDAQLQRVHSPIGIEINAETPEEIALSVLADVVRARRVPPADGASR